MSVYGLSSLYATLSYYVSHDPVMLNIAGDSITAVDIKVISLMIIIPILIQIALEKKKKKRKEKKKKKGWNLRHCR